MTEDDVIKEFGFVVRSADLPRIRSLLVQETSKMKTSKGNEALARLLCVQLFAHGNVEDSLLVWRAKRSNFDAGSAIDVQLMCGAGLEATQEYLRNAQSDEAAEALKYLNECERAGDFQSWSPHQHLDFWHNYYKKLL
jgi:hypothetical protein